MKIKAVLCLLLLTLFLGVLLSKAEAGRESRKELSVSLSDELRPVLKETNEEFLTRTMSAFCDAISFAEPQSGCWREFGKYTQNFPKAYGAVSAETVQKP